MFAQDGIIERVFAEEGLIDKLTAKDRPLEQFTEAAEIRVGWRPPWRL